MNLPFFYVPELNTKKILMDEDASKHMINVLRMQKGKEILLTDGKGKKSTAVIIDDNRKKTVVEITATQLTPVKTKKAAIGISLVKNVARFEWFLEKATEIGVNEIIPLVCERTEREKFRMDRMKNIIVSAMLQSQQSWMPALHSPQEFSSFVENNIYTKRYIAHCIEGEKHSVEQDVHASNSLMLIGPEGDFTPSEIQQALALGFLPVSLGETRLRTETAGIVAATLMVIG